MEVAFDRFELDTDRFELRSDGDPISLEPQVFEVLAYLVTHAGRVVTKHELLDTVWGSRFVSESALTSRIKSARQALGDDGRSQRYIRTVHGRGYRFIGEVVDLEQPALDPPSPVRFGNLPVERTPLFGRDADITSIVDIVARHRLVSLLGIGGTGKTRLSIAAARAAADGFADGTWFVDLVPVEDRDGIELALAEAVGVGLDGARPVREQLTALLARRRALIVFDNAEHVADELAGVLDDLLERTSEARFVVTSRVPLGLPDERRLPIEPLRVVPDDTAPAPAVELLQSAAERFGADLDATDPLVLARICHGLDGLPLAIELAAAQLRHLDPTALAERLDRRFEVLADRTRHGSDRHLSLHAVLRDTWDALDDPERALLEQIAVFPGVFSLDDLVGLTEANSTIGAGHVELSLGGLVDRSLVIRDAGRSSRYRLLETVKLFARQQTDPATTQAITDAHAAWCLEAVGTDPRRYVFDFDLADWCTEHHADLRVAGNHLRTTGRTTDASRLLAATALAMHIDTGPRAAAMLESVDRDLATVDDSALAAMLHATAVMCGMATRSPDEIAHHGEHGLEAARRSNDPVLVNAALVLCSWSTLFTDPERALRQTAEASDVAAAADERLGHDFADGYRAFHLAVLRRYDEAEAVARAVVERAPTEERVGYPTYVGAAALTTLLCVDDPDAALPWCDELLGPPSERNSMWARDLVEASIHGSAGRADVAATITEVVLTRLEQAGQDPWPDLLLPAIAYAVHTGDMSRAAGWLDAIRTARRPTQSFQATVLYRRLRDAVGRIEAPPPEHDDLDRVGRSALEWLVTRA